MTGLLEDPQSAAPIKLIAQTAIMYTFKLPHFLRIVEEKNELTSVAISAMVKIRSIIRLTFSVQLSIATSLMRRTLTRLKHAVAMPTIKRIYFSFISSRESMAGVIPLFSCLSIKEAPRFAYSSLIRINARSNMSAALM